MGLITVVGHSVGRKIHFKCHQFVSKMLSCEERDWREDVYFELET